MVAAALFAFALHAVVLGQPLTRAVGAPDPQQTQALHALFDATWEADMRRYPEWASYVGDHRYGDRLYDASPAARAAEFESARQSLARARKRSGATRSRPQTSCRSTSSSTTCVTPCA